MNSTSGSHADSRRFLDDVEKQLYKRIVAKLKYLAHDWSDLPFSEALSVLA